MFGDIISPTAQKVEQHHFQGWYPGAVTFAKCALSLRYLCEVCVVSAVLHCRLEQRALRPDQHRFRQRSTIAELDETC
jgi:hypothetical protein